MLLKTGPILACARTLGAAWLLPSSAHAILCDELTTLPNKIYGAGGSAVTGTLKKVALAIAKDPNKTDERTTIIYHDDLGACAGYQAFLSGKITGQFRYWVEGIENDVDQRCDAKPGGQELDFAHMGNDASFCPQGTLPEGFGDFTGAVQTMNVITDKKSNEVSISAEALYLIYGFGPQGEVSPWTDGTGVFRRQFDSFAGAFFYESIGIPALSAKWAENEKITQGEVISAITKYANNEEEKARQTLGYVSGSAADTKRSLVKTLAYQHYDQECGVYPDSSAASFDKINVRTGKYYMWTAGHFYAPVDAKGKIINPRVANLFGWFTAKTKPPGTTVNAFEQSIAAGDIPQCAMQATREGTLGAISSYADPKPCSCYFEHVTNSAITSACTPCTSDSQCGGETPACNFGYCEAYRSEGEEEG
jgi:hypothetical protein